MTDLNDLLRSAIIKGIQKNASRIFDTAQDTEACFVPVDTGTLKQSGRVIDLVDGASIQYRADYAADVEYGTPGEPWSGTQTVYTKAHKRKGYMRKDGTYVNAHNVAGHNKRYENSRLIGFRPKTGPKQRSHRKIYRVMSAKNATEGQFFLTRALQQELPYLAQDMEQFLKELERL